MGTKNIPGKFDCYANALPDEPMFILLARDPKAPDSVQLWAEKYKLSKEQENGLKGSRRLTVEQYTKYCEALDCADAMAKWAKDYQNQEKVNRQKSEWSNRPITRGNE